LLTWVTFVVFMPNTLASIATGFSPAPMTSDEFMERKNQLHNNRWRETYSMRDKPMKLSKFVINDAEDQERLNQEHLTQQIAQVEVARAATRISPAALVQHLLESFAGTGFSRHLQFLENVRQYVRQYREFVIDTDSADPDSPHFIGISEGISRKPVSPESIPRFEDSLSLSRDFNDAAIDLMLLMLLVLVLMSGAYLVFVRAQV
ncbi:MAG: DUF3526 domain-containing protein, partial [Candidatus Poribacteria bacterium]|nr:DUF3526 domain-containing protein [Candidatus Poribacteria bacterium]